jgi:LPXTG-motif cell wall-anchored protein
VTKEGLPFILTLPWWWYVGAGILVILCILLWIRKKKKKAESKDTNETGGLTANGE